MATVAHERKGKNVGGRPRNPHCFWGEQVSRYADPQDLTYEQLGEICGVSDNTFGEWMSGESKVPAAATEALADYFGIPMDALRTKPRPKRSRRRPHGSAA